MTAETASTPAPPELVPDEPSELEEIAGLTNTRIVVDECLCEVSRLKTREFFALMRVLTRGMGSNVANLLDGTGTAEEMAGRLLGALLISVPEAEADFIVLVKRMVMPVNPDHAERVKLALDNPSLETMLEIAETVAMQEAGELTRLGKAAQSWWEMNKATLRQG